MTAARRRTAMAAKGSYSGVCREYNMIIGRGYRAVDGGRYNFSLFSFGGEVESSVEAGR